MRRRGERDGVAMTVVRSASGVRVDCDGCGDHAASPGLSIEVLRRATGYVQHEDRDWCPDCSEGAGGFEVSLLRTPTRRQRSSRRLIKTTCGAGRRTTAMRREAVPQEQVEVLIVDDQPAFAPRCVTSLPPRAG